MGRLLVLLGIVAMIGGGVGLTQSIIQPISNVLSNVSPEAIEAQARALCEDGETLETEQGQETYSQTTGWGRPTYFYCVNAEGVRREVTEEFGSDLIETTTSTAMSAFSGALLWVGVSMLGVVLLIIGIILMVRNKARSMNVMRTGGVAGMPSPISGNPVFQQGIIADALAASPQSDDPNDRLKKLNAARAANLITQEEYDRLRQSILNKI